MRQLELVKRNAELFDAVYKVSPPIIISEKTYNYIFASVSLDFTHVYVRYVSDPNEKINISVNEFCKFLAPNPPVYPDWGRQGYNCLTIGLHNLGYQIVHNLEVAAEICPAICSKCKSSNEYLSAPKDYVCTACKMIIDWAG